MLRVLTMLLVTFEVMLFLLALYRLKHRRWGEAIALGAIAVAAAVLQSLASSRHWSAGGAGITVAYRDTLNTLAIVALAIMLGVLLAGVIERVGSSGRRQQQAGSVLLAGLVLCAGGLALWQLSLRDATVERDPARRTITLPEGFTATVIEHGTIGHPTALVFAPDGTLYVNDQEGRIWRFPFQSAGTLAAPQLLASGFENPLGLAWLAGELYVSSTGRIDALQFGAGGLVNRRVVTSGLPALLYTYHQNNQIAFGPDGRLYIGVGSTSNARHEQTPLAASILSMHPDGSDLSVVASGLRNPFGLMFDATGQLWATDNGPAGIDPTPPDELNAITPGADYGFPEAYSTQPPAQAGVPPIATFPPHSSADGLVDYESRLFPSAFSHAIFVVAWNTGDIYRVTVQQTGQTYLQQTSLFATGLLNPLAIIVDPAGRLIVADYGSMALIAIAPIAR